ncbi:MAG: hypothetical protein H0U59_08720 [Gemmatimonadaceae bacterium]|nr:hypothetical protein [Gemmatimonadaceae bacterium]
MQRLCIALCLVVVVIPPAAADYYHNHYNEWLIPGIERPYRNRYWRHYHYDHYRPHHHVYQPSMDSRSYNLDPRRSRQEYYDYYGIARGTWDGGRR